ncbi:MAG: hypothetical protein HZA14_00725 [Nitrospirae bacterium]|nr:hypothetical protein [Nitrospirota bacterium]
MKAESKNSFLLAVAGYFFLAGIAILLIRAFFWGHIAAFAGIRSIPVDKIPLFKLNLLRFIYLYAFLHFLLGALSFWVFKTRDKIKAWLSMYEEESHPSSFLLFFWSSISGLYLFGLFLIPMNIFKDRIFVFREDNVFETMTVILFIISAVLLLRSSLIVKQINRLRHEGAYRKVFFIYIGIAVVLLALAGEEISWGQRLFHVQTPEFYAELNRQKETNIHNLVEMGFTPMYALASVIFIVSVLSVWLFYWKDRSVFSRFVLPHPELYILATMMAIAGCGMRYGELFEELLSIFALFYSIRIIKFCRFQKNNLMAAPGPSR